MLAERHSPRNWLQTFREAGDGTSHPNMPVIMLLRQHIWEQTEAVVVADVQMDDPEVAVPAPWTYREERWPPARGAEGQPDGHI
eukprot:8354402-Alexandrium_andersonii.AAC.1